MNTLKQKILEKESGFLFYGLTPPKLKTDTERIQNIANKQIERLQNLDLDGLILYDIQDESSRTNVPRPFPFLSTLSPEVYSSKYLKDLKIPKIIYKSIGKQNPDEFKEWLRTQENQIDLSVFVGAPSKSQESNLSLREAYEIKSNSDSSILLGGVTIPERHQKKGNEHIRVFDKINKGCNFFISQCVYNLENTKNFLSDYYYWSKDSNQEMAPIIFTLTPCGSLKTLEFMNWLGIDIPKWLKSDLQHSNNILSESVKICTKIATELLEYSKKKNIPIGFNIESVAIRKEEIDASIDLLKTIKALIEC
jgi:5,10-methylenetetrahydrofolate reductase